MGYFLQFMIIAAFAVLIAILTAEERSTELSEERAKEVMPILDAQLGDFMNTMMKASWNFDSNITDYNLNERDKVATEHAKFVKDMAFQLKEYPYESYKDEILKRQFKKHTNVGYAILSAEKYKVILDAITAMASNYAKVKICSFNDSTNCDLQLEPEITEILAKSHNEPELRYYWQEWYNKAGAPVRGEFQKYIDLNREAALLNGYENGADSWLDRYEVPNFEKQIEKVIEQIRPLYEQIHGYVRYQLRKHYGNEIVSERGPIPMHLLGDMWGQNWNEIADLTAPFQNRPTLDVTDEMIKQNYTARIMFEKGEEFFLSLNMTKLPESFWKNSIIEKQNGVDMICHPSAWDFYKDDDVRIKQCTRVNMNQYITVHHELGHVQYFLQYKNQPFAFKGGANAGFHEAVGDVLSLSVSSPKHLKKVGLIKDLDNLDEEILINNFYKVGLEKIVFLPFAYAIDKYRWGIFRGEIEPSEYNCQFWNLRHKYSGIEPPVKRTEKDLDAPAKYHVSVDAEFLRYFVAYVIQFQFHKTLCEKAGEYVPNGGLEKSLLNCDIYQSTEAGNAFKAMLALGASKPWPDAMEVLTGQREMDAGPLLEYFQPLADFLDKYNKDNDVPIGWTDSNKFPCIENDEEVRK